MSSQEKFIPKIDYNNCITNVACSILKYFDITPRHNTLPELDELFNEKKPENVILLLCDGLGSRILDKVLKKDDYLIKKRKKEICAVFPPTTAADLTSVKTGLNPPEHGWVGWTSYIEPINKIIMIYKDIEKGKKEKDKDFLEIKDKYFKTKTVVDLINEQGKYKAYETTCYPYNVERDIDKVFELTLEKLKTKGKKYIFSYYPEPDDFLHAYGVNSEIAIKEIEKINKKVEEYSKLILEHEKTVMIIVADHGHLIGNEIDIRDKEIVKYLKTPKVFLENRAPCFLVKKGEEKKFEEAFLKDFGKDYFLLSKEEVLKYKIFGDYEEKNKHELFESSFGDYLAMPKDSSNTCLMGEGCGKNTSYHGGYSDDEIYIPLIIINN